MDPDDVDRADRAGVIDVNRAMPAAFRKWSASCSVQLGFLFSERNARCSDICVHSILTQHEPDRFDLVFLVWMRTYYDRLNGELISHCVE
jgi:hypothetical protein